VNDRKEGGDAYVADNPVTLLDSQPADFSTSEALGVMEDFITNYGDEIDGVYAHNDLMALGAHQAISSSNLEDVAVTGIDGSEVWVDTFSEDNYYGTIAQLPEEMVNQSVEAGIMAVEGEELEDYYQIEGLEVTAENADDYPSEYF